MKAVFLMIALIGSVSFAKDVYVNGYQRSDGKYVDGYYRTTPNNTTSDNYSTQGNYNPYTGRSGTKPNTDSYNNSVTPSGWDNNSNSNWND